MNRFATCLLFSTWLSLTPLSRADDPNTAAAESKAVSTSPVGGAASEKEAASEKGAAPAKQWKPLSAKWTACQFGGDGPTEITPNEKEGAAIKVEIGDPLSGVRWDGEVAKENYEIEMEGRRTEGFDFFCGLTFPVGDSHVTFVLGGWGGGVVGISNIDGMDASENAQAFYKTFANGEWQKIRVRVDPEQIQCWINDKVAIEQTRSDHRFDLRYEMEVCRPLGLAAYMCKAEYRNIRVRELTKAELAEAKKAAEIRAAEDDE
ncbi:3-keto-disaccharide hydrolase [Rubripirellula reticaptiva]|uniref:3-keto-alpha-glucoside-1,2-lyase/3-keto-2-hydroxy-glucal hydratase domain-containing protein n=1 Tax=Rubripirellula reticaptiva TaxID=2528013 RepID=A0A5C6EPJ5_9BACT|nr:DUF1080 domain-containing protein [Rubripirellula reticaptiva]TWU51653.1 hypothetical protein Poly59_32470 [Rubripirellula reticaptiva]